MINVKLIFIPHTLVLYWANITGNAHSMPTLSWNLLNSFVYSQVHTYTKSGFILIIIYNNKVNIIVLVSRNLLKSTLHKWMLW